MLLHAVELTDDPDLLAKMTIDLDEMIPDWSTFCLYLGVKQTKLDRIEQQVTTKKQTQKMLDGWIRANKQATIQKILEALESSLIENNALAARLKRDKIVEKMLERNAPPAG